MKTPLFIHLTWVAVVEPSPSWFDHLPIDEWMDASISAEGILWLAERFTVGDAANA